MRMITTRIPIIPAGTFASFVKFFSYLLKANHIEERLKPLELAALFSHKFVEFPRRTLLGSSLNKHAYIHSGTV